MTNRGETYRNYLYEKETGRYIIYKNAGDNNNWLKMKLIGTKRNKDGIGSKVKLYLEKQTRYRQNNSGMECYIQHSNIIHYGFGNETGVNKKEVVWTGGSLSNFTNIKSNQTLIIKEK